MSDGAPGPARWLRFGASADLAEGAARSAMIDDVPLGVARVDGRLVAFHPLCPHVHADLTEGILEHGGITCPEHLWHFSLTDGSCPSVPGARVRLYPVREVDGWIEVEVSDAGSDRR